MAALPEPGVLVPVLSASFNPVAYPLGRHPARLYLARLQGEGQRSQRGRLERIARWASAGQASWEELPWHLVRYPHAQAIRTWLAATFAPATARAGLAALRGVLREAWRLELVRTEDYRRAVDLEAIRGEAVPAGRHLAAAELLALVQACAADPGPIGRRDAALFALLYAGLRRSELAALELDDLDDSGGITVRRGKGRKARRAWLPPGGLEAMRDWLAVRGPGPGPLLVPVLKGGRIVARPLSAQAVRDACVRRGLAARLAAHGPHDWRRTWIGDLLDAGADLVQVQALAGHDSPVTTARYDRRPDEARRRAVQLLRLPYVSPPGGTSV